MGLRGKGAKPRDTGDEYWDIPSRDWTAPRISRAERVIRFIESLPITAGTQAGKPFKLRPWQKRELRAIYATHRGRRKVRTALLSMGRKNGKTALAAALALAHLVGPEGEERGQVYSAAADRDQAGLIFQEMEAMIRRTEWLDGRINVKRFTKEVEDLETGSYYKALSSDASTKYGFSASFVVCDELAQWPNRRLWDALTTSTGARAEPLVLGISTQAADDVHFFSELLDYGLDPETDDPTFYASLYAAPDDCDLEDPEAWAAANPALGDFRSRDELRTAVQQAKRMPTREPTVRNLYLNQRVSAEAPFIAAAEWLECKGDYTAEDLEGMTCWGGLDLGATRDLTSLALFFPEVGRTLVWAWCPGENLAGREDEDRVPYRTWADQGVIEPTPGRATDKRYVAIRVAQIAQRFNLQNIAYDRWGITEFAQILADEGIELPLQEFGQGFKDQGPAVRAFEEHVYNRTLGHNGNPVLTWALSNVVPNRDPAGNVKLDKARARERIDPVVALVMAVGLASREREQQPLDVDKDLVIRF